MLLWLQAVQLQRVAHKNQRERSSFWVTATKWFMIWTTAEGDRWYFWCHEKNKNNTTYYEELFLQKKKNTDRPTDRLLHFFFTVIETKHVVSLSLQLVAVAMTCFIFLDMYDTA